MPDQKRNRYRRTGEGEHTWTDNGQSRTSQPGEEHDLTDEQFNQARDRWEPVRPAAKPGEMRSPSDQTTQAKKPDMSQAQAGNPDANAGNR